MTIGRRTRDAALGAVAIAVLGALVVGLLLRIADDRSAPDRIASEGLAPHDGSTVGVVVPWRDYVVRDDQLVITYEGSACQESNEAIVDERSDRVVVTVRSVVTDAMCAAVAVGYEVVAHLDSPLGNRPVYDASCLARMTDPTDPGCRKMPG